MKRPTQADVARTAGVSRATVSYVLNDQVDQRIPISAETRQRVLEAIAQLGYEPDARAQSLRSGNTKTIGVLLPLYENPYFWQILRGISSEAEASGYSVLLSRSALTIEEERQSLRELSQRRVDGLILLVNFKLLPAQVLKQLHKSGRAVVEMTSSESVFDCIQDGYQQGTLALLDHLFELGHRRIGFVYGVADRYQGVDRLIPYQERLEGAGIVVDDTLFRECGPGLEDGYETALQLLRLPQRPTALMVINDLLAMAVLRAATDLGLHVPNDLSVVSFDDIPFTSYTIPRLTTVAGEPELNGRRAVQLVLKRLAEPERPHQCLRGGWKLYIRESTARAPVL